MQVNLIVSHFSFLMYFFNLLLSAWPLRVLPGCLHFAWANLLCLRIGVVSVQRLLWQHRTGHYRSEAVCAATVGRGCTRSLLPVLSRTLHRQQDGMVEGLQLDSRDG